MRLTRRFAAHYYRETVRGSRGSWQSRGDTYPFATHESCVRSTARFGLRKFRQSGWLRHDGTIVRIDRQCLGNISEDSNDDNYTYPWNAGRPPHARNGCLLFPKEGVRYRDGYARYFIRSHRAGRHESQSYLFRTSRQKRPALVHARFPRIQGVPSPSTNVRYKRRKRAELLRPGKAILR